MNSDAACGLRRVEGHVDLRSERVTNALTDVEVEAHAVGRREEVGVLAGTCEVSESRGERRTDEAFAEHDHRAVTRTGARDAAEESVGLRIEGEDGLGADASGHACAISEEATQINTPRGSFMRVICATTLLYCGCEMNSIRMRRWLSERWALARPIGPRSQLMLPRRPEWFQPGRSAQST